MKKSVIIGSISLILIALVSGVYFFMHGDKSNDLVGLKNRLQNDLTVAVGKLNKEKQKLNTMTNSLEKSFPLAFTTQDQMRKASKIISQTDFMFSDPSGLNPKLIVKNPLAKILINEERKNVNMIISKWQNKIGVLFIGKMDLNESEVVRQDIQTIKNFISDLSRVVESLTPENSGLSQSQIDEYLAELPPIETVDEVLNSLETAVENFNKNNSQGQGNPNSSSPPPEVSPEEVVEQQEVVNQIQNETNVIQEQINQIEQQIEPPSIPNPPVTEEVVPVVPPAEPKIINPGDSYPSYPRNIGGPSIIIQPGPPRLIEGTNQY